MVFGLNKAHWQEAGVTMLMASPMHAAQIIEGRAGQASGKISRYGWPGARSIRRFSIRHWITLPKS